MPRQRAAAVLPPPQQLQRLQEWLRARLAIERLQGGKKQVQRCLQSIEGHARKLAELLDDEAGQLLLDELYRAGSDMRARHMVELALQAARLEAASRGRDKSPQAEAARLFLHLLHLNGSRVPSKTGSSAFDQASPEVRCFHSLLLSAGLELQLEAARQQLAREQLKLDLHLVPDLVATWVD